MFRIFYPEWWGFEEEIEIVDLNLRVIPLSKVIGIESKDLCELYDHKFKPKKRIFKRKHGSFYFHYHKYDQVDREEVIIEPDVCYLQVGSIYFLTSNGLTRTSVLKTLGFSKIKADIYKWLLTRKLVSEIKNKVDAYILSQQKFEN